MKVLVCIEPVDLRGGIDGLARLFRQALREEPMSGTLFYSEIGAAPAFASWDTVQSATNGLHTAPLPVLCERVEIPPVLPGWQDSGL